MMERRGCLKDRRFFVIPEGLLVSETEWEELVEDKEEVLGSLQR
jgi:hypothetical protein